MYFFKYTDFFFFAFSLPLNYKNLREITNSQTPDILQIKKRDFLELP